MAPTVESDNTGSEGHEDEEKPLIMAHELSDRYVFTETENTDGWIACNLTLKVDR